MKRRLRWTSTCISGESPIALKLWIFAGLDDKDVAGPALELFPVNFPLPAPLAHELNLVVRMTVRPRSIAGLRAEQKNRDAHIAVVCADDGGFTDELKTPLLKDVGCSSSAGSPYGSSSEDLTLPKLPC